jgi:hypothetical protein
VRGEAAFRGAGDVEVGELAEPEAAVWLRHGESKWLVIRRRRGFGGRGSVQ